MVVRAAAAVGKEAPAGVKGGGAQRDGGLSRCPVFGGRRAPGARKAGRAPPLSTFHARTRAHTATRIRTHMHAHADAHAHAPTHSHSHARTRARIHTYNRLPHTICMPHKSITVATRSRGTPRTRQCRPHRHTPPRPAPPALAPNEKPPAAAPPAPPPAFNTAGGVTTLTSPTALAPLTPSSRGRGVVQVQSVRATAPAHC